MNKDGTILKLLFQRQLELKEQMQQIQTKLKTFEQQNQVTKKRNKRQE
ncbi:hypothetical protein [Bacillus thuringiensis]|nr:hypothetical protein [Bacillus thuringiensis]